MANNITEKLTYKLILRALLDVLPLAVAVVPWGILTGALAIQIGMTAWQAQCMSLLVFAGAAQLSSMTLMSAMASSWTILGTTVVISARHLLYSMTFRQHVSTLPLPWRISIAFVLTDEMFAVSHAYTQRTGKFSPWHALVSGFGFYVIWNLATLVGIVAGDYVNNIDELGLDFAIVAIFIAMTFDRVRENPVLVAIVVSGVVAVLVKPIFTDAYILIAGLLGMCAAYVVSSDKYGTQENQRKEI